MKTLNQHILEKSTGFRCGVTLPFQEVESSFADMQGIYNISLPEDSAAAWRSASGSMSRSHDHAVVGAIAESMERYAAAVVNFPVKKRADIDGDTIIPHSEFALFSEDQYHNPDFMWKRASVEDTYFGEVYSLYTNERTWVPQELIGLGPKFGEACVPSTSTGFAAHFDKNAALLSALQELLERDALTVYWVNSLGGREITLDEKYTKPVQEKSGKMYCFDITQDWNPHPVVMVCGYLPQRGKKRISMGVACRESYEKAIEKAYVEWLQGTIFAGFYDVYHPGLTLKHPDDVKDFDEHAVYYTLYPEEWEKVPLLTKRVPCHIEEKKTAEPRIRIGKPLVSVAKTGNQAFLSGYYFSRCARSRTHCCKGYVT